MADPCHYYWRRCRWVKLSRLSSLSHIKLNLQWNGGYESAKRHLLSLTALLTCDRELSLSLSLPVKFVCFVCQRKIWNFLRSDGNALFSSLFIKNVLYFYLNSFCIFHFKVLWTESSQLKLNKKMLFSMSLKNLKQFESCKLLSYSIQSTKMENVNVLKSYERQMNYENRKSNRQPTGRLSIIGQKCLWSIFNDNIFSVWQNARLHNRHSPKSTDKSHLIKLL